MANFSAEVSWSPAPIVPSGNTLQLWTRGNRGNCPVGWLSTRERIRIDLRDSTGEAGRPNHSFSEASAFILGPNSPNDLPPGGLSRPSALRVHLESGKMIHFPTLPHTAFSVKASKLKERGVTSSVYGWRGTKKAAPYGQGNSGFPFLISPHNCEKNTRPLSISQRDKTMSIFLTSPVKLRYNTLLIASRRFDSKNN